MHPMFVKELTARRATEFEQRARTHRLAAEARVPRDEAAPHEPGPARRRAGRLFLSVGWRLGGPGALPPALARRLA
ncbi:MAG: hypothetical protein ACYDD4_01860 [Acidimicrobiales bacterium]